MFDRGAFTILEQKVDRCLRHRLRYRHTVPMERWPMSHDKTRGKVKAYVCIGFGKACRVSASDITISLFSTYTHIIPQVGLLVN